MNQSTTVPKIAFCTVLRRSLHLDNIKRNILTKKIVNFIAEVYLNHLGQYFLFCLGLVD